MAQITAITASTRREDHFLIKVDGKTAAVLSGGDVVELGLSVGDVWDEALADRTDRAKAIDKARHDALRRLERKGFSRRRLTEKLRAKGHDGQAIEAALDKLQAVGLVDDLAFGRALIRELSLGKAAGPRLVRAKLFQAGLSDHVIEQLLAEGDGAEDEQQRAKAVQMARKRYAAMARLDEATRKRRLYGMLARRGFDRDQITAILQAVTRESTEEPDW